MTPRAPPHRRWRFIAMIAIVVFVSMLLLQEALARALAGWLAGVWVTTIDLLLRILGAPLGVFA